MAASRVKKILWIASTPIALTCLLAVPMALGQHRTQDAPRRGNHDTRVVHIGEGAEAGEGEGEGGHEVVTNPITNFATSFWGYRNMDAHGGTLEPGEHPMPAPFSMALLNFAALIFIVAKLFAPGIAKMTRERHDEIAKNLAESAKIREEAQAKLDEFKGRLAGLDKEIAAITAGIRAEAEAERKRILSEAEARVERMQRDAEQQIAADMQRVRIELEREAVLQAIAAARKILEEKTTEADQRALVDSFIKQVGSGARGRA
jgi:F-type H+-transporting ATPase subunit b